MMYRWIGAVLVLAGCGGFGFSMAAEHRRKEKLLESLMRALKVMRWELQYRLTPLPELCTQAGRKVGGPIGQMLLETGGKLEREICPDVSSCVQTVLSQREDLPRTVRLMFRRLGTSLGQYDLPGQLEGLQDLSRECQMELQLLKAGRGQRLRSYETLGLCGGAALAILLL